MTFENKLRYKERVKNILSFKNDDEKINFEAEIIHIEIINQILQLMEKEGISKSDLADILGTSKSYITQLFNGDKILNLRLLAKLQRVFKIKFKIVYKSFENKIINFSLKNVSKDDFNFEFNKNNEDKVTHIRKYLDLNICRKVE